jgi:excisionase family DNA binding protein
MGTPARSLSADVVTPVPADADELAQVLSFMEAHEVRRGFAPASAAPAVAFYLSGADERDRVELTEQVHAILKQVVGALSKGQSISILTRDEEITTQQAAEILGLSRPTVVRLIKDGELRAHVPGAQRRKLLLADVLAYREELRARRNRFITETSSAYDEGDADDIAALLVEARKAR